MNCPACDSKRLHAPEDWEYHPYAHHGCTDGIWTHPDLDPGAHTGRMDNLNSAQVPGGK